MTRQEKQQQYLERCMPAGISFKVSFERNLIILSFNKVRLVSSSIEEMREKIKVALNK